MQKRVCGGTALRETHRSHLRTWKQVHMAEYHYSVGLLTATDHDSSLRWILGFRRTDTAREKTEAKLKDSKEDIPWVIP